MVLIISFRCISAVLSNIHLLWELVLLNEVRYGIIIIIDMCTPVRVDNNLRVNMHCELSSSVNPQLENIVSRLYISPHPFIHPSVLCNVADLIPWTVSSSGR